MLGFPIVIDQGACRIVKIAVGGGGYLGYCERLDGPGQISGIIVTFTVPTEKDVDNWYAHLLEQGVTIPDPPKDNPRYDIYHFFFQDPDGYLLEIQAFHDPDWKKIL
jgi:catechol 2,3-dioxygenase-like lactoylglutathione lyase family enzyme